jgi:hypothetical protein
VDVVYGLIGANAMNYRDQTQIGGTTEAFLTTHWSLIEDIRSTAIVR